mmetsp:Transcript_38472/g.86501  ORF Transcript_38472/g.86501 Transcript_38472/m.86501 type:complete len:445 (-) Transcript_38472:69-1403(-)
MDDSDDVPQERVDGEVGLGADGFLPLAVRTIPERDLGHHRDARERTDHTCSSYISVDAEGFVDYPVYKAEAEGSTRPSGKASQEELTESEAPAEEFQNLRTFRNTVTEDIRPSQIPTSLPAHTFDPQGLKASRNVGQMAMLPLSEFVDAQARGRGRVEVESEQPVADAGIRGCSSGITLCGAAAGELSVTWTKKPEPVGMPSNSLVPVKIPSAEEVQQMLNSCGTSPDTGEDMGDQEWFDRVRITGVVGRLVQYPEGRYAAYDIKGLARTPAGHLLVTQVSQIGPANQHGVKPGDRLVSINGQKPCPFAQADEILRSLSGPTSLVFLGFIGKIPAEVLVDTEDSCNCGLPQSADLVRWDDSCAADKQGPKPHIEVHDEYIFHPGAATLMLETQRERGTPRAPRSRSGENVAASPVPLYELHQSDAQTILTKALTSSTSKQTSSL